MKTAKRFSSQKSGTATVTFHDVIACFSEEQWTLLQEWQKELYDNVMKQIHQALFSLGPAIASSVFSLRAEEKEGLCHMDNQHPERGNIDNHSPGAEVTNMDVFGSSLVEAQYPQDPRYINEKENQDQLCTENDVTIVMISASIKEEEEADSLSYQGANEMQNMNCPTGHEAAVPEMPTCIKEEEETSSADHPDLEDRQILSCSAAYEFERERLNDNEKNHSGNSGVQEYHKQHTRLKLFSCPYCEKCFTRKDHLIRHQPTHTGVRNFKCSECQKSFTDKSTLSRHMRIHTGEKPFSCTECGKRFTDKSTFNQHRRTHTGLRPYHCTECEKSFSKGSSLRQHLITHTGLKPFPCTECEKSFTQKSTLLYHMGMHKGMRPFHCTECDKSFLHKSHLRKHLNFHSKTKISMLRMSGELHAEGPSSMSAEHLNQNTFLSHPGMDAKCIKEGQSH